MFEQCWYIWKEKIFCVQRLRVRFSKGAGRAGCHCGCHKLDAQIIWVLSTRARFCFSLNYIFVNLNPVKLTSDHAPISLFIYKNIFQYDYLGMKMESINILLLLETYYSAEPNLTGFFHYFSFKACQYFISELLWRSFFLTGDIGAKLNVHHWHHLLCISESMWALKDSCKQIWRFSPKMCRSGETSAIILNSVYIKTFILFFNSCSEGVWYNQFLCFTFIFM